MPDLSLRPWLILTFCLLAAAALGQERDRDAPPPRDLSDPCTFNGRTKLNPSEKAGCEIWFKATAGTARFFTYVYQQRLGFLVDWYGVLNAPGRATRFSRWGLINDPACCRPGDPDCPARTLEQTYGFDYCPGDDVLLEHVGKPGYRDPACALRDAEPSRREIERGLRFPRELWQSACDLEFGTSAGAMGFRKLPNPKFDPQAWKQLNEGSATWDGFRAKLGDGSLEPPFLIGISCGACHIAFDPVKPFSPPHGPAHPAVSNLSGTIGNQYARVSEILVSGMARTSLEWQVFALLRPGTVDTSAIPTDQINNAGTINAIMNLRQRPVFQHEVMKWRPVKSGEQCVAAGRESCWCEPGRDGKKCWKRSLAKAPVHHILKGGEDSIGALEALQRVYLNIGSCAESSWVNHLSDSMQLHPGQRGYGQTPVDIGQARRDCPAFRAIEDRLPDLLNFLMTGAPADLREARENERRARNPKARYNRTDLIRDLEADLRANVERGRRIFARTCARCHSSLPDKAGNGPFLNRDFHAVDPDTGLRKDWLGSDVPTAVTKLESNAGRALHSNHLAGHVWEEYASETYRHRPPVTVPMSVPGEPVQFSLQADGGRGYYRNVSLLSLWATAPYMHDNGTGPDLCRAPEDQSSCRPADPSVEGRYRLFKESMAQLLDPERRRPKITLAQEAVHKGPLGLELTFPSDTPAAYIGNFRHKEFVQDFTTFLSEDDPERLTTLKGRFLSRFGPVQGPQYADRTVEAFGRILADPRRLLSEAHELSAVYSNSIDVDENKGSVSGHPLFELFGTGRLSDQDKRDLTAFLATL